MSRNGVMTVSACKRYMDYSAALGLNTIVLYTEDTYTVPEYPYMGYLRGRYTPEELRELDAYAAELGIELVPCIQTLAHLGQFLQWKPNESLKDQPTCLLADEPDTYAFIEAEIRAIRACVSGSRLHIGMDEAHGVGLGAYYVAKRRPLRPLRAAEPAPGASGGAVPEIWLPPDDVERHVLPAGLEEQRILR